MLSYSVSVRKAYQDNRRGEKVYWIGEAVLDGVEWCPEHRVRFLSSPLKLLRLDRTFQMLIAVGGVSPSTC